MNFVSEKGTEQNGEEEPQDTRPLFERLKEVRDKKQAEFDEEHALKNQFRGIDEDEVEYLHQVSKAKLEAERQKKQEERELLKSQREAMQPNQPATSGVSSLFTMPKIQAGSLKLKAKSTGNPAGLLIRKRKHSDDGKDKKNEKDGEKESAPATNTDSHPIIQKIGEYPSTLIRAGGLPGLGMYDSSSDDDSFDEDEGLHSEEIMKAVHGSGSNSGLNETSTKTSVSSKSASNTSLNRSG